MLVDTKAKVGVFSIALGAYLPQFPTLVDEFKEQYKNFKKTIPSSVEVIDGGIVTTKELSQSAGDLFRSADVDLVIVQLLTYATSYNMLPAVRDLDVPVVLVNVQKLRAPDYENTDTAKWLGELYACGAVGEMVADLERAGKRHAVITGVVEDGDSYVERDMATECPVVFTSGVGIVPWMVPGGKDIAVATSKLMREYDVAIWAHHGMFASGEDFDLTFGLMHTVEKAAEILVKVLSMQPNKLQTIQPEEFRQLAKDFNVTLPEKFLYNK